MPKGYLQTPDFDFGETYSPVIKPSSIRIVLTVAVTRNWIIKQLDVSNAFLHEKLQEIVFMSQPEGYVDHLRPHHVCQLSKAIYGLKQAPRAWYERFRSVIIQWNFVQSKSDLSLFIYHANATTIYVLIYVDDIIITGSSSMLVDRTIHRL